LNIDIPVSIILEGGIQKIKEDLNELRLELQKKEKQRSLG